MKFSTMVAAACVLSLWALPAAAQDPDSTAEATEEAVEETGEALEEAGEAMEEVGEAVAETAEEVGEAAEEAAEAAEEEIGDHDWEFALAATENVAAASGDVKVTEGDAVNTFVVEVRGLPPVDELDAENRDVNAYTVWIVPGRERVSEATLAGVVNVNPDSREGILQGTTSLDSFGIIVTAMADGAPATIGGVPVLTGIPVTPAPAEAPSTVTPPAADEPVPEPDAPMEDVREPEAPGEPQ